MKTVVMGPGSTPEVIQSTFFRQLADGAAPQLAYQTARWRALAQELGWYGPVLWQVSPGYTLREHAVATRLCYDSWQHIKEGGRQPENDEPTIACNVFWIPRLVKDSTFKTRDEQLARLAVVRKEYGLADHHLANFGSAALVSGLILTHYMNTGRGERTPLDYHWVRTDTLNIAGLHLVVGFFGGGGLGCGWVGDYGCTADIGAFPVGVEPLAA